MHYYYPVWQESPWRTGIEGTDLAARVCVPPLITEGGPLSKGHLGKTCMWSRHHLMLPIAPNPVFSLEEPAAHSLGVPHGEDRPSLRRPTWLAFANEIWVFWMEALRTSICSLFPHLWWWKQRTPRSLGPWVIERSRACNRKGRKFVS